MRSDNKKILDNKQPCFHPFSPLSRGVKNLRERAKARYDFKLLKNSNGKP